MKNLCDFLHQSIEWEQIASGFNKKANFPHCVGAVDGKHIRLKKPINSGSMYINYKDFFYHIISDRRLRLSLCIRQCRILWKRMRFINIQGDNILENDARWQSTNTSTMPIYKILRNESSLCGHWRRRFRIT